ncbi:Bug family tripartite tricarboxylate transporter substrate binding protein [Shumkonia mesophila]|uniref:Bug family tripartite tricarboxylate transporter substrate binding protein n=1 Tax=Shumkonia mesophila TaxID=2838854 RepID=UPI0029343337|nr:tripartite tricarboxylate transporter substrate binding protein [Shumkonia mesophila]
MVNRILGRVGVALAVAAGIGLFSLGGQAAAADNWPDRPVQVIVSYGAGGASDRQARLLAAPLEKALGVPVVVQNMPGAGGQVAAVSLLRAPADGYTVLATNEPDLSMTAALKSSPYKYEDLDIIMVDVFDPRILLVTKDSPIKTFADFVNMAKAEPGKLSISVAQGAAQELFAKWLVSSLGLKVRIVGFKGGGEAATAMLGGHVTATLGDDFARLNIRDLSRTLLLGSPKASPRWPEAELLADALKPYGVTPPTPRFLTRYGVYVVSAAFRKAHPDRYLKLQKAIATAMSSKDFKDQLAKQGFSDLALAEPGDGHKEAFAKTLTVIKELAK